MGSDQESTASQEDVLRLVSMLRLKVGGLQERITNHLSTQGEFWDSVKERLSTMEARFASFEVKLASVPEDLWITVEPEMIFDELRLVSEEIAAMSDEIHKFTSETPM